MKEPKTATEVMMLEQLERDTRCFRQSLEIVLEFVERYNKMDKEKDVAEAANYLSQRLIPSPKGVGSERI